MEDIVNNILRRFYLLSGIVKSGNFDKNNPVYDEFHKIGLSESDTFIDMIKSSLKEPNKYTVNFIRKHLLNMGYSKNFVDYLFEDPIVIDFEEDFLETDEDQNIENDEGGPIIIDEPELLMEDKDFSEINEDSDEDQNTDEEIPQIDDGFELRDNQKRAIDKTIEQDFQSGIHNQIMGAGKSIIILKTIAEHYKKYQQNMVYLLLCDRIEILDKMFLDDKKQICSKKIKKWKENGIIDLSKFDILEYVINKKKDLVQTINKKNKSKPMLIICNNAFIRSNQYTEIRKNRIALTLVDECHSVSAPLFYQILKHLKYQLKIPIIGFSATPLRPQRNAEKQLCDIFSKNMNPKNKYPKLNIISQYGLFEAIRDGIVLPPYYHFIEVKKAKHEIPDTNYDITYNILNRILSKLPYKKLICWCRNIKQLIEWYHFFQKKFPKLTIFMTSFRDKFMTQKGFNCDINKFYQSEGNSVLLCVNKCREGSDIPYLDCGNYLDAVKTRSILVSMQTGGAC